MRMMNELKHMFLYSSDKNVYVPIDETDKRRNSAILLLTPDIESTKRLINLPYIYNPNLFTSFYIDRSIDTFVNDQNKNPNIVIDPVEEQALSEAMVSASNSIKFKFSDGTSIMDENYIRSVYNKNTVKYYAKLLGMDKIPDKLTVIVHPNVSDLRKNPPKYIKLMEDNYYSYFENGNIHLLSKLVYDPQSMRGDYETYVLIELLYALMMSYNEELHYIPTMGIAFSVADISSYMKKNKNNTISTKKVGKFSEDLNKMISKYKYDPIIKYINTADINVFTKYTLTNNIKALSKLLFESSLSYYERQQLLPSDFGIPNKRKYPLNDEDHVRAAIRMFNNCDPDDEKELAEAIIKKMKKFGITKVSVGENNRFKKYYDAADIVKESVTDDYNEVLKVCTHLSEDEFKRISFNDVYKNSEFIIKRFIAKLSDSNEAVGFLDVYRYPTKPNIGQIVIAVDDRYRGIGAGKYLANQLINSNIPDEFGIDTYYWTAHEDNYASQHLALGAGFIDTNTKDSYGRKIFLKKINIKSNDVIREAFFNSDNNITLLEDNASNYSSKLRRYIYNDRLKNSKEVFLMYDDVKASCPSIIKTYAKLKMYKKLNAYVDLSYYNSLFLKNNIYTMDKGVNLYFDFINRLINNPTINSEYSKQTIFIPVDSYIWHLKPDTDLTDYKANINPISIIFRLIRTNPEALRTAWKDKSIIFVGDRGYFTVDFNQFALKDLARFKTNLHKINNANERVVDDYEIDSSETDISSANSITSVKVVGKIETGDKNTRKAMAMGIIDRLEHDANIKINNVSALSTKPINKSSEDARSPHLILVKGAIDIPEKINDENGIAIITMDPDGPNGFERLNKTALANVAKSINTYCMP